MSFYHSSFDFTRQVYFFGDILEIQNICVLHNSSSFNGVMIGNIWEFNLPCNLLYIDVFSLKMEFWENINENPD